MWIGRKIYTNDFPIWLRELILKIVSKDNGNEMLFIAIEKNYRGTYDVFCKKKFYNKVSLVASHFLAYFLKLYREKVITISNPEY